MIKITDYDKNYDEALFISKADHIFIMILDAIMDNDMNSVKHYLADDVYERFNNLVNQYKENNYIRIFDEMNVKSTEILDSSYNNDSINIDVLITSRYMDYFLDNEGEFVSGNNEHRIETKHYITFTKSIGAKELNEARRCPSCGSTLDINNSGVCPYCKQIIEMKDYDYIITKINTF